MDNGTVAIITVISGLIGGFLMKAGDFIFSLMSKGEANKEKDRLNTLNDYRALLERQDRRLDAQEEKIRKLESENRELSRKQVQAITWIKSVEHILDEKGIDVPEWLDGTQTDTGSFKPLPPGEVHGYGDG